MQNTLLFHLNKCSKNHSNNVSSLFVVDFAFVDFQIVLQCDSFDILCNDVKWISCFINTEKFHNMWVWKFSKQINFIIECFSPIIFECNLFYKCFNSNKSVLLFIMCEIYTGKVSFSNFFNRSIILVKVLLFDFIY